MWRAKLVFDETEVPVALYAAAQQHRARFRLLEATSERPVEQRMLDPEGHEVAREAIHRGLEVEPGRFVLLRSEELERLEPPASREIAVLGFVSPGALDPALYDRPYWLAPDGDEGGYYALAHALRRREVVGLARWALRGRRYAGALRAEGPYLMLSTLRPLADVIPPSAVEAPSVELDEKEAKLAEQLVEALADDFDPAAFEETYRARLAALLEAKGAGEPVSPPEPPRARAETTDLADALRASLDALEREAPRAG